jgi:hypothetical protein
MYGQNKCLLAKDFSTSLASNYQQQVCSKFNAIWLLISGLLLDFKRPTAGPQRSLVSSKRPIVSPQRSLATSMRSIVSPQRSLATSMRPIVSPQRSLATSMRSIVSPQRSLATSMRSTAPVVLIGLWLVLRGS